MRMQTYQALFSRPENVARVQQARRAIEQAGGKVIIGAPAKNGMITVILTLPETSSPDDFLPGLPFYPV